MKFIKAIIGFLKKLFGCGDCCVDGGDCGGGCCLDREKKA